MLPPNMDITDDGLREYLRKAGNYQTVTLALLNEALDLLCDHAPVPLVRTLIAKISPEIEAALAPPLSQRH